MSKITSPILLNLVAAFVVVIGIGRSDPTWIMLVKCGVAVAAVVVAISLYRDGTKKMPKGPQGQKRGRSPWAT